MASRKGSGSGSGGGGRWIAKGQPGGPRWPERATWAEGSEGDRGNWRGDGWRGSNSSWRGERGDRGDRVERGERGDRGHRGTAQSPAGLFTDEAAACAALRSLEGSWHDGKGSDYEVASYSERSLTLTTTRPGGGMLHTEDLVRLEPCGENGEGFCVVWGAGLDLLVLDPPLARSKATRGGASHEKVMWIPTGPPSSQGSDEKRKVFQWLRRGGKSSSSRATAADSTSTTASVSSASTRDDGRTKGGKSGKGVRNAPFNRHIDPPPALSDSSADSPNNWRDVGHRPQRTPMGIVEEPVIRDQQRVGGPAEAGSRPSPKASMGSPFLGGSPFQGFASPQSRPAPMATPPPWPGQGYDAPASPQHGVFAQGPFPLMHAPSSPPMRSITSPQNSTPSPLNGPGSCQGSPPLIPLMQPPSFPVQMQGFPTPPPMNAGYIDETMGQGFPMSPVAAGSPNQHMVMMPVQSNQVMGYLPPDGFVCSPAGAGFPSGSQAMPGSPGSQGFSGIPGSAGSQGFPGSPNNAGFPGRPSGAPPSWSMGGSMPGSGGSPVGSGGISSGSMPTSMYSDSTIHGVPGMHSGQGMPGMGTMPGNSMAVGGGMHSDVGMHHGCAMLGNMPGGNMGGGMMGDGMMNNTGGMPTGGGVPPLGSLGPSPTGPPLTPVGGVPALGDGGLLPSGAPGGVPSGVVTWGLPSGGVVPSGSGQAFPGSPTGVVTWGLPSSGVVPSGGGQVFPGSPTGGGMSPQMQQGGWFPSDTGGMLGGAPLSPQMQPGGGSWMPPQMGQPMPDGGAFHVAPEEPSLQDKLRAQLEYYFSDQNLERDFFLRRKMTPEGFINLIVLQSFHRLRRIAPINDGGGTLRLLVAAILASPVLELDESQTKVRRRGDWQRWLVGDAQKESESG